MTIDTRFEVSDPCLGQTIESCATRSLAVSVATAAARQRGHDVEIYDRMARSLHPNLCIVTPEGVITDYHIIQE